MEKKNIVKEQKDQVIIYPDTRIIKINSSRPEKAYGLFDSQTGTQVSDFVNGNGGQIEFNSIRPNRHYDVGVIENTDDEKPQFAMNWTKQMRDNTDAILSSSDNLPVEYPYMYEIINNGNNSDNVFDMVDNNSEKIGEVINLKQTGDKPRFTCVHSFKVVDDTKK